VGDFLHRRRWATPYLLLTPGMAWLIVFFVLPMIYLGKTSLETGLFPDFTFNWQFSNFSDAISLYHKQFVRSFVYAGIATAIALVVSYPLAYWIAFRGGRWKNLFLLLVVAPFFVSFVLRTISWKFLLTDEGIILGPLKDWGLLDSKFHILSQDGRLLATPVAVIAGLTYNFLPFMVLPLFASIDKIDHRLIEASADLYSRPIVGFFKVTWPLSLPGVVSGTLLTFIPAVGDYINAELLGSPKQRMIGNVIQNLFTDANDYPAAGALSVMLMLLILVMVLFYVRRAGTEELL